MGSYYELRRYKVPTASSVNLYAFMHKAYAIACLKLLVGLLKSLWSIAKKTFIVMLNTF